MHYNIQMQMKLNFIKSIWVWHMTLMQAYIYIYLEWTNKMMLIIAVN